MGPMGPMGLRMSQDVSGTQGVPMAYGYLLLHRLP